MHALAALPLLFVVALAGMPDMPDIKTVCKCGKKADRKLTKIGLDQDAKDKLWGCIKTIHPDHAEEMEAAHAQCKEMAGSRRRRGIDFEKLKEKLKDIPADVKAKLRAAVEAAGGVPENAKAEIEQILSDAGISADRRRREIDLEKAKAKFMSLPKEVKEKVKAAIDAAGGVPENAKAEIEQILSDAGISADRRRREIDLEKAKAKFMSLPKEVREKVKAAIDAAGGVPENAKAEIEQILSDAGISERRRRAIALSELSQDAQAYINEMPPGVQAHVNEFLAQADASLKNDEEMLEAAFHEYMGQKLTTCLEFDPKMAKKTLKVLEKGYRCMHGDSGSDE